MSVGRIGERIRRRASTAGLSRRTVVAVVFGDRVGLVLFLAAVCLFGVVWRTSILINDSYTLANGLYSLSNGHVALTEAVYSSGLDTPGTTMHGGQRYARNYGALALSLPFLFGLEGLAAVVDLRIALVALWSLASLALVAQTARLLGRDAVAVGGSLAVLGLFGLNVALARPLGSSELHVYALQLSHLTVAAFVPVFLYRLLGRMRTRRLGALGAGLAVVGTPLAFWATVPKRHVITGAVVVCVAYCLYRSRVPADGRLIGRQRTFRALAYGLVGLYAWVHAPEALLLCVVLGVVDVPTAPDNGPHTLAVVVGVFVLSLIPFLVTNVAVSGAPFKPPRLLAGGSGIGGGSAGSVGSDAGPTVGSASNSGNTDSLFRPLASVVESGSRPLLLLLGQLADGFRSVYGQPDDVYHAFIRSGSATGTLNLSGEQSVNLSLLESAPVLAALFGLGTHLRQRPRTLTLPERRLDADRTVDLFAAGTVVGVVLLYVSRLPIHAQVTVRYLFPLYPLGVYLLLRLPAVRRTLSEHWQWFVWTVTGTVLVGGQLAVLVVTLTVHGIGEAFQFHALVALGTATPLAVWSLNGRSDGWWGRIGAVLLGLATAVSTVFVLLAALAYYPLGHSQLLPIIRAVSELLPPL